MKPDHIAIRAASTLLLGLPIAAFTNFIGSAVLLAVLTVTFGCLGVPAWVLQGITVGVFALAMVKSIGKLILHVVDPAPLPRRMR